MRIMSRSSARSNTASGFNGDTASVKADAAYWIAGDGAQRLPLCWNLALQKRKSSSSGQVTVQCRLCHGVRISLARQQRLWMILLLSAQCLLATCRLGQHDLREAPCSSGHGRQRAV